MVQQVIFVKIEAVCKKQLQFIHVPLKQSWGGSEEPLWGTRVA